MTRSVVLRKLALAAEVPEPNAFSIATSDAHNRPNVRTVLLKGLDAGLVFYTNYDSEKGKEIQGNPYAAVSFLWLELERQVRVRGKVVKVSEKESDEYFYSRPFESQLGAIASSQSQLLESREHLENVYAGLLQKSPSDIKRPNNWGGYRILPEYFEFWQGRPSRLHDRIAYEPINTRDWRHFRLYP